MLQHDFFRSIDLRKLTAKEVRLLTYLLTCACRNPYVSTTTPKAATHSGPNAMTILLLTGLYPYGLYVPRL